VPMAAMVSWACVTLRGGLKSASWRASPSILGPALLVLPAAQYDKPVAQAARTRRVMWSGNTGEERPASTMASPATDGQPTALTARRADLRSLAMRRILVG
jgi:hypothetical protein